METLRAPPVGRFGDIEDNDRVLIGCTLPPKVAGVPRGAVLLSVPHVLPSTAADAVAEQAGLTDAIPRLPRAPLVRVRWWGEDRPGSTLFRPTRISHEQEDAEREAKREETDDDEEEEEEEDSGDSSIRMRYPVCVPLEQLIDYLRDMKELVFDVVDRTTRKKIGRSEFPFQLDMSSGSADESMKELRRTNALCEIHSTVDGTTVLGYLTVNFEIEWPAAADVLTPLKWANSMAMVPSIAVNPRQPLGMVEERRIQQRLSFSSMSSSSTATDIHPQAGWRRGISAQPAQPEHKETTPHVVASVQSDRLDGLLEKGRALERSMSKAVTEEEAVMVSSIDPTDDSTRSAPSPTSMMMLMAPYEAMTEDLDTSWERVLEEADKIQPPSPGRHAITDPVEAARRHVDAVGISLGDLNALEISFESMELEQAMMDRLRQLREGSISTRFSPIQLVVSHEHPQCLLQRVDAGGAHNKWIDAFAVNSSLRKRQWRTNYAHTLPLLSSPSASPNAARQQLRVNQRVFRFRVRCKPQHASPTGTTRKRAETPSIDLAAEVAVDELLDHRDREWVLSLPLRIAHDGATIKTTAKAAKKSPIIVGRITVNFQFCVLPAEKEEEEGDHTAGDGVASSQWSRVDTTEKRSETRHHHNYAVSAIGQHTAKHLRQILTDPHQNAWSELGTPVFFGLLLNRAVVRWSSPALKPTTQAKSWLSLRIEYGTPAFFGRSGKALRLKRSAKASLHPIQNDRLKANVRHMNAFPLDISNELVQKLEHGLVILEAWIQEQSTTLTSVVTEKLIGVIKIPLHTFIECTRDVDTINRCLSRPTPFVGVDQDFPIVDPLNDQVNGHVRVCMAFGSAEQMFNLKSTLAAVVKLQSLARGSQVRIALGYWKRFELTRFSDDDDQLPVAVDMSTGTRKLEGDEGTLNESAQMTIADRGDAEVHDSSVQLVEPTLGHPSKRVVRVELRIEIREKYATTEQGDSILGCEVYGHLRFNDAYAARASLSSATAGPRFTLWWDAHAVQLNSHFVHTLQASSSATGILLQDVVLLFRVAPQPPASVKRSVGTNAVDPHGAAAIDLASVVSGTWGSLEADSVGALGVVHLSEDVDLPIEWDSTNVSIPSQRLAGKLPLRIGMRITHEVNEGEDADLLHGIVEAHELDAHDHVTAVHTLSRTERLLPASLRLSLDFQRIADVRDMIQERLASASHRSNDNEARVLQRAIERGTLRIAITTSFCLGVELHLEERRHKDTGIVFQDDRDRWHKQFRFDGIELDVSNGVQVLPSITQGDVHVLVHPELVTFLQEEGLTVEIVVCDDDGDVSVGTVSIPLSAILFRPSGVQGSFPVRVANELAGRVGVHLYIDQDDELNHSIVRASASSDKENDHQIVASSQTPEKNSSIAEVVPAEAHEQTLEQAVASIHEAALQIQHRLARLTTRSNGDESDKRASEPVAMAEDELANVSSGTPTLSRVTPTASDILQEESLPHEEVGEAKAAVGSKCDEPGQKAHNAGESEISEFDCQSIVKSETVGDEIDAFRPITLASLGIDELDLSPVSEAQSPTFPMDDDSASSSRGSNADDSSPTRSMEGSVAGTGDQVEQELDKSNVGTRDQPDTLSTELEEWKDGHDKGGAGHEEGQSPMCASEGSISEHSSPRAKAPLDRADDVMDDVGQHDDLAETFDELAIASTKPLDTSSTTQQESEFSGSVVDESRSDAHPTEMEQTQQDDYDRESIDLNETTSELGLEETNADALQISDLSQVIIEKTEVSQVVAADAVTPTPNGQRHREGPLLCDSFTQTQDDDVVAAAASNPHRMSAARNGQAERSYPLVESGCQTLSDSASIPQLDEWSDAAISALSERAVGEETQSKALQEMEEISSSLMDHHSTEGSVLPSDASPAQLNNLHQALPAEKFQIAWQLLNEIRVLYVNPDAPELAIASSSTTEETTHCIMPAQDLFMEVGAPATTTSGSTVANEAGSSLLTDEPENARREEIVDTSEEIHVNDQQAPPAAAAEPWAWRDAASLRAEVENRLQASKREYEEALALSQSISSIKSWSVTSHLSTTRQWEGKAHELSASALAKRRHSQHLFRVDTETERIARIMQGSLRNWLHDDDQASETSEDEADLVDNYF